MLYGNNNARTVAENKTTCINKDICLRLIKYDTLEQWTHQVKDFTKCTKNKMFHLTHLRVTICIKENEPSTSFFFPVNFLRLRPWSLKTAWRNRKMKTPHYINNVNTHLFHLGTFWQRIYFEEGKQHRGCHVDEA